MNDYPLTGIIADGEYKIATKFVGVDYAVYATGTYGGGTLTYGYTDSDDNFVALKKADDSDLTATANSGYIIIAPPSGALAVKLTGATAPNIKISLARRQG